MMIAPLTNLERRAWWQLGNTPTIGPITFRKLIDRFGSASKALEALPTLARRGGRTTPLTPPTATQAEDALAAFDRIGARFIPLCEPDYPELLRQIDDAPPTISVLGAISLGPRPCISMVGARNASLPGRKIAYTLSRDLGAAGLTVVSGLARGIDTAAHEGSLATGTIAVVAGGVDVVYPPENEKLYRQIVERGAIISEHAAGLEPKAPYFPRRNRIIAGLSRGTCVVEATIQSGSLITARAAAEQGRDVFAVPGSPLDPRAGGPNHLIRDGAVLVERAEHILQHLESLRTIANLADNSNSPYLPAGDQDQDSALEAARALILENLTYTPVTLDELVRACQLHVQVMATALLDLELAERVERLPGNRIVLIEKGFISERERSGYR
jgi:DNA processing protein